MTEELIQQLTSEMESDSEDCVHRCDAILARLVEQNDPSCISELISCLDDESPHTELMYSIVHTIEYFSIPVTIHSFLDELPSLYVRSPKWTVVLQIRILNSSDAFSYYQEALESLPDEQKGVVRDVLTAVQQRNARFEQQCKLLVEKL